MSCSFVVLQYVLRPKLSLALITRIFQLAVFKFHIESIHLIYMNLCLVLDQWLWFFVSNVAEFAVRSLVHFVLLSPMNTSDVIVQGFTWEEMFPTVLARRLQHDSSSLFDRLQFFGAFVHVAHVRPLLVDVLEVHLLDWKILLNIISIENVENIENEDFFKEISLKPTWQSLQLNSLGRLLLCKRLVWIARHLLE